MPINVEAPHNGGYVPGVITSINYSTKVAHVELTDSSAIDVDIAKVRILRESFSVKGVDVGERVEALFDKSVWLNATIVDIKSENMLVVRSYDGKKVDLVSIANVRSSGCVYLYGGMLNHSYGIPEGLLESHISLDVLKNLLESMVPELVGQVENDDFVLYSLSADSMRKGELLLPRMMKDELGKMHLRRAGAQRSQEPDDAYKYEFTVNVTLMRLVIGSKGVNIKKARAVDGVMDIKIIEDDPDGFATIQVFAKDWDAAEQAKKLLEYVSSSVIVHRPMAGRVIGKHGANLKNIISETGIVDIKLYELEDERVRMELVGRKGDVEAAALLIQFDTQRHTEMDSLIDNLNNYRFGNSTSKASSEHSLKVIPQPSSDNAASGSASARRQQPQERRESNNHTQNDNEALTVRDTAQYDEEELRAGQRRGQGPSGRRGQSGRGGRGFSRGRGGRGGDRRAARGV